jgi:DamX protein
VKPMSQDTGQQAPDRACHLSDNTPQPTSPTIGMTHSSDPFSSSNKEFFSGAERRILLDEVIHLCQFGNNLVAVLGEEGLGKTTLLSQARYELAETAFCCFINGSVSITAEDIFTQIITQLELPAAPASSIGEMLATLRHSMAEGDLHRVIIIIDDAHHLNDQILSALVSLLQGHQGQHHLHILMGGDSSIARRLDQFEMIDVLVYDITLNPLALDEVSEYLDFKLMAAGYRGANLLSEGQIKTLWQETGGYPAAINESAQTLLFQQDIGEDDEDERPPGLPLMHMLLLVVLLAALIMALFYMGGDSLTDGEAAVDATEANQASAGVEPARADNIEKAIPEIIRAEKKAAPTTDELAELIQSETEKTTQQELDVRGVTPKPVEERLLDGTTPTVKSATPIKSTSKIDTALPQAIKVEVGSLQVGSEPVKSEPVKPEPLKLESVKPAIASPALKNQPPVVKQAAVTQLTPDEKEVMSWPSEEYTLQVMAAAQPPGLRRFIAAQPNRDQLRLVAVERGGKPWYVVLLGIYDNGDLARQAIQSLPQAQVNAGPWTRKISDIRKGIETVRDK